VLLDSTTSVFDADSVIASTGTETERHGLRRLVPSLSLNPGAPGRYQELRRRVLERAGDQRVLVIGAGEGGVGIANMTDARITIVASDVAVGPSTDICLDAHRIPFADDTFDAIVAQAVLEHVASPPDCTREMARVLKPGGLVYAETPFMQQVHMGGHDFSRYTLVGHRRLFREFEELSSGVAVGPGSALAWALVYFILSFSTSKRSRQLLNALASASFFWLKYFDRVLNERTAARDAACGVYFMGSLSSATMSDLDVVETYRGAFRFRS
jgi:SAM-dependent methyltransferase